MFKQITVGSARSARPLIGVYTEDLDRRSHGAIPADQRAAFVRGISTPGFKAEVGELAFGDDLVLVGLGSVEKVDANSTRRAGAALVRRLDRAGIDAVRVLPRGDAKKRPIEQLARGFAEGMALANWRIQGYDGTAARSRTVHPRLRIAAEDASFASGLKTGLRLAEAVNLARMVATTPPNVCHPAWIAKQAKSLANSSGLTCTVIDAKKAAELGMGGIVNVGKASEIPPCLVQLEWNPGSRSKGGSKGKGKSAKSRGGDHLVLVGKTITYDTGGYSLKISNGMKGMKYDMCGGAAVLGAMKAIADAKLPVRVTALLPAAENMISDEGYRPDDVITMYGGTTVEVTNTDAEGRLVLGDALAYACDKLKPTAIIDLATLTGGVVVALGHFSAGMFCEDDGLRGAIECAASGTGEKVWRLPVWDEHREFMRSSIADILNSNPKRSAHPIQGAAFLSYFVDKDVPWAHLDIAGVANVDEHPVTGPGASGWGVRLLHDLVAGMGGSGGA
jgi:leucyl aminopeptidase